MRTIIAGSRTIKDRAVVERAIADSEFVITSVVCGGAVGVDYLGYCWANDHNIPVAHFPAEWDKYGRSAGCRRNEQMGASADALIAVWDGKSRGTAHMIRTANARGLAVHIHRTDR